MNRNKIIKKEEPKTIKTKKDYKIFKILKYVLISLISIILILFGVYKYYNYTTGFTIYMQNYDIEKEYGRFLIEINDEFIDCMVSFDKTAQVGKSYEEYSDLEKEKMTSLIRSEGSIISRLENTDCSEYNKDYEELRQNMLESYALYIQGQVMKLDYIYQTEEGLSEERFTLGHSLTNLMGNFIIEYNPIINNIRHTDYHYVYSSIEELDTITGDFEQSEVNRDEDGNLILDENKNYLYLPGMTETEEDTTADDLNKYINNYLNLDKD